MRRMLRDLRGGWFCLTPAERRAVLLLLALFLIGLMALVFYHRIEKDDPIPHHNPSGLGSRSINAATAWLGSRPPLTTPWT